MLLNAYPPSRLGDNAPADPDHMLPGQWRQQDPSTRLSRSVWWMNDLGLPLENVGGSNLARTPEIPSIPSLQPTVDYIAPATLRYGQAMPDPTVQQQPCTVLSPWLSGTTQFTNPEPGMVEAPPLTDAEQTYYNLVQDAQRNADAHETCLDRYPKAESEAHLLTELAAQLLVQYNGTCEPGQISFQLVPSCISSVHGWGPSTGLTSPPKAITAEWSTAPEAHTSTIPFGVMHTFQPPACREYYMPTESNPSLQQNTHFPSDASKFQQLLQPVASSSRPYQLRSGPRNTSKACSARTLQQEGVSHVSQIVTSRKVSPARTRLTKAEYHSKTPYAHTQPERSLRTGPRSSERRGQSLHRVAAKGQFRRKVLCS